MTTQRPLYCIGWDYATPNSIALKLLLEHPKSPWKAAAIVHDEIWVPAVDGINLMTTKDFLHLCQQSKNVHVLLNIKHPVHQKIWARRAKEYGFIILDEGEIFQSASHHLQTTGHTVDVGVMKLPAALDTDCIDELAKSADMLADTPSRALLSAYVLFLKTGLLDALRPHVRTESENPLTGTNSKRWMMSTPWSSLDRPGLAWEIAPQRTSFLDQAVLLGSGSIHQWSYAFSSTDSVSAVLEGRNLKTLLRPFGIAPRVSYFSSAIEPRLENQVAVQPYHQPELENHWILAHIDDANPFPLIKSLADLGTPACMRVRLGHSPRQLLMLLQHFGDSFVRLDCDRPGPLGLHAHIEFNLP